jgi:hypothetical protein
MKFSPSAVSTLARRKRLVFLERPRHGDFAMVGVAALIALDAERRCTHLR